MKNILGEQASPNPDYPQEITNVTGNVEVKVQNKNLWNANLPIFFKDESSTITANNNGGIDITLALNATIGYIVYDLGDIKKYKNKTITLSIGNMANALYKWCSILNCDSNGNNRTELANMGANNNKTTLTIGDSYSQSNLAIRLYVYGGTASTTYSINNVQVELNSTATDWKSHKEQVFIFPLGNEKLMLGDYLADDGIHHVRGQYNLNGDEYIVKYVNSTYAFALYIPNNIPNIKHNSGIDNVFCTKLMHSTLNNLYYKIETAGNNLLSSQGSRTFAIMINNYTDINVLKEYLKEQYNNGTPVTVEYELEEEIIVPYTSAQQEVYNQIKQTLSYEEQTNISSNTIALFNVEAYQSTKLVLEEMATAIVALGGV